MFVPICNMLELGEEGELYRFDIQDRALLVVRFDGAVFVTDSICTHEEADLSLGMFDSGVVKCPLHGAKFKVNSGEVVSGPEEDPTEKIPDLRVYQARIENNEVFANL
jgi:nitrite reductase/ring-hydroxylating ferredoxin subunit